MSEFKIKVSVELDSSDLESKLNALGKDQKIKIDIDSSGIDKIENQFSSYQKIQESRGFFLILPVYHSIHYHLTEQIL